MQEQRPVTRSVSNRGDPLKASAGEARSNSQSRAQIQQMLRRRDHHEALTQLMSMDNSQHWVHCLRAQTEYQLLQKRRALSSIRQAEELPRAGCIQCLRLLMRIMQECPALLENARDIVNKCLQSQDLPEQIARYFNTLLPGNPSHNRSLSSQAKQSFEAMLAHYRESGVHFGKIQVVQKGEDYRVAIAKRLIKPNEVIIFVPQNQIITLEIARNHPTVRNILSAENRFKSPKHCLLSVFLLAERSKGPISRFSSYIRCLPKGISTFPVAYSDQLLDELAETNFYQILQKKKEEIRQDFDLINKNLPQQLRFSWEDFLWARMMVSSRIFGIVVHGVKTDALVPIADMLNHRIPKATSWFFSSEKNAFIVQNMQNEIKEGEQIFDSYGAKCNSRFLLNYGFVQPQNSHNQLIFIPRMYSNADFDPPLIRLNHNTDSEQLKHCLTYYRQALSFLKKKPENYTQVMKESTEQKVSKELQIEVWTAFVEDINRKIAAYPTTIKVDEKLLQDNQISFNKRNCVEIRLGEKRILELYKKMGKDITRILGKRGGIRRPDIKQYEKYLKSIGFQFDQSEGIVPS